MPKHQGYKQDSSQRTGSSQAAGQAWSHSQSDHGLAQSHTQIHHESTWRQLTSASTKKTQDKPTRAPVSIPPTNDPSNWGKISNQGITTLAHEAVSPVSTFTVSPIIPDDESRAGDDQMAGTQTAQTDPHHGLSIQTAQPDPHYGLSIQTAQPDLYYVGHDAAAMRPETQAAGLARCNATMGRGRGPAGPGRQSARPSRIPPASDPPPSISRQCPDTNPRETWMAAAVPIYTQPSYGAPDPRQVVGNFQQAPNINQPGPRSEKTFVIYADPDPHLYNPALETPEKEHAARDRHAPNTNMPGPRRETRHPVNSHPHSHCHDPTPAEKMQVVRNWQAQNPPAMAPGPNPLRRGGYALSHEIL